MTKIGPRDDTKVAAIKLEWWPRSDWNKWPPSLESTYRRIWHLWGTSYIYWVNTEFKLYEMTNNRPTQHPELSLISLGRPVASEDGELPRGASGTVLHVYPQALAYEVEFFEPFHTVATVEATAIRE